MDLSNENVIQVEKNGVRFLQFKRLLEFSDIVNHALTIGTEVNFKTEGVNGSVLTKDVFDKNMGDYKKTCKAIGSDFSHVVRPIQRHTDEVKSVKEKYNLDFPDLDIKRYVNTDGLVTDKKNILLTTTNADCISMLFFDPIKKIIGNVHSGWRGTYQQICVKTVQKMQAKYGCNVSDIICLISPSIRKCHFEVKKDVKDMFLNQFGKMEEINNIIEEKEANMVWCIDTVLINKIILKEAGLQDKNIIDAGICTICNSDLLHSNRVEKENYGVNAAFIELR